MKYTVKFTATAEEDLRNIAFSVARISGSITIAKNLVAELRTKTQRLEDFPLSGAIPNDRVMMSSDYRFLIHNDYLTFYRIEEETKTVYVFAVFNGRLDYTRALNKYL